MPATDRSVDTVASLLLTIHRDESGVFYTSIETMPPGPRMAQPAILPAYASERDVETGTFATAGPESARAARWRRCLIAAAAVAVLVGAPSRCTRRQVPRIRSRRPDPPSQPHRRRRSRPPPPTAQMSAGRRAATRPRSCPASARRAPTSSPRPPTRSTKTPSSGPRVCWSAWCAAGSLWPTSFANGSRAPVPTSLRPATPISISRRSCTASTRRSPRSTPTPVRPTPDAPRISGPQSTSSAGASIDAGRGPARPRGPRGVDRRQDLVGGNR